MNPLSAKRRAALPAEAAFRQEMFALVNGHCEWCGNPAQEQHELGRGPLRQQCRVLCFACLALCSRCHGCLHRMAGDDAQRCGLAILKRSRPSDYNLTAFLNLIAPHAPFRIMEYEIDLWARRLSLTEHRR